MEEKNQSPPQYSAQPPVPQQHVQYMGQPGTHNPAFVQAPAPPVIYLQPGQQILNGQVVSSPAPTCDKNKMPSVACPIFACICCWPLGIGALIYYLRANNSQGNCFDNSHIIYQINAGLFFRT